ncbi:MAG: hypothetical protein JXC32_07555 [Anaerolineae bacterium]|nr:hypothetical protein [Anaerolineae bacterium]
MDGKIYAIGGVGGLTKVEVYDPETNSWTARADMPTGRVLLSTSVVEGKIYAIGGNTSSWGKDLAAVEAYDPETDTWTRKADMPTARSTLSTNVVGGKIYAIGGSETLDFDNLITLATVEVYDPVTDSWTARADMPRGRDIHAAVVVDEKIYVMGGTGGINRLELYDPATDSWTRLADLPGAFGFGAVALIDDSIYLFGGGEFMFPVAIVYEYEVSTDSWTRNPDMPFVAMGTAAGVVNGKAYVIGGTSKKFPQQGPDLRSVWEYAPER